MDQHGFVSFCNQRDLEVLLGYAFPGQHCSWLHRSYPSPEDHEWYGPCADEEDLIDDLFERELRLRNSGNAGALPSGLEIVRRVHLDANNDVEELFTLLWDRDNSTGVAPDTRLETISDRWKRVERNRLEWR
jgi:hypothetical protein